MDKFAGKVSIVTGGASGLGHALCEELARREATVVVADINHEGALQIASTISSCGGCSEAAHLDVARDEDVKKLVYSTAAKYGRLDYMFNNAGIAVAGEVRDMSPEHWQSTVEVNLLGVIHGTTAAYALMARQGFGHIVNTSSIGGLIGVPMFLPYTTTKFAVVGLSWQLRAEAAGLGVKVSVVCPGLIESSIWHPSNLLNARREEALARLERAMKMTAMKSDKAARLVLDGVERNQAFIVFPWPVRLAWWLYRFNPGILELCLHRQIAREFRKIRLE